MIPERLPRDANDIVNFTPRAVAHLRSQLDRKRLGLVFGSGASRDLGFPIWPKLVRAIAKHEHVDALKIANKFLLPERNGRASTREQRSLASITQMLFGTYRAKTIKRKKLSKPLTFLHEQEIRTEWMKIIHSALYKDVSPEKRERGIKNHEYLNAFAEIIKLSPMTVNYNFDDTLEKLLMLNRSSDEKATTRGYETTYKPNSQFKNDSGVIYHPNGFLPSTFEDGASPDIIFSDESFRDQLISAASGQYLQLSHFLFRNTCLLVGLSLEDTTLQHLLRQSAVTNPGHIHYLIHFVKDQKSYDRTSCEAIFDANFSCYNLYTLFLDNKGISALAKLMSMKDDPFDIDYARAHKKFVYYIIGAVGVGKSSVISNFRNLHTHDEWIDERRTDMAVPEQRLPKAKKKLRIQQINQWTAEQFRKKNLSLEKIKSGIHISDRCPLDPLTFGEAGERPTKADHLLRTITSDKRHLIENGHVIYLDGSPDEIQHRGTYKHKHWRIDEIKNLIDNIESVYGKVSKTTVCTRGRTLTQVTRELTRIIFTEKYVEADIQRQLASFCKDAQ